MEAVIDIVFLGMFELFLEFFAWFFIVVLIIRYLITLLNRS